MFNGQHVCPVSQQSAFCNWPVLLKLRQQAAWLMQQASASGQQNPLISSQPQLSPQQPVPKSSQHWLSPSVVAQHSLPAPQQVLTPVTLQQS